MLKNVSELEKKVFVSVNNEYYTPYFESYDEVVNDYIFISNQDFVEKYEIRVYSEIKELHLVTTYKYKTFDGGKIEVELHKFDGDYNFKYKVGKATEQVQIIHDEFEFIWCNNELADCLF